MPIACPNAILTQSSWFAGAVYPDHAIQWRKYPNEVVTINPSITSKNAVLVTVTESEINSSSSQGVISLTIGY